MSDIHVPPQGWWPRAHQMPLWEHLQAGGKRAIAIWHRRAGKDEIAMHFTAVQMLNGNKAANFWHALPEYSMCRKAIWNSVNPHTGIRRIDECFPQELRVNTNDSEMLIRFRNGSTWQCIGSDSYNRTVGASAAGIVYSEWALCNPSAWAYHRPMIEENNGWACFISTPRGHNHAKTMYEYALQSPAWFAERLTAKQTGMLTDDELAEALKEYQALYGADVGRAMYDQEMMVSFNAALLGAAYALECQQVREEGRIVDVEPDYDRPISRAWDIGIRDDTSVWWWQTQPSGQILILDHLAMSGVGVEVIRDEIFRRDTERGWKHGDDHVPHDAKIKEWGTGRTRIETMSSLGLKPVPVPLASILDGINAARRTLPLCVFHPRTLDTGFAALEQYRREWDDEKKAFRESFVHDWTSHPADAFRYMAMAYRALPPRKTATPKTSGWVLPPPAEQRKRGGLRL